MSDHPSVPPTTAKPTIETIQQRLSAATPGPWHVEEESSQECTIRATGPVISGVVATVRLNWIRSEQRYEQDRNVELIAHAPTDIAWLLARLVLVERQRDELRARNMEHEGDMLGMSERVRHAENLVDQYLNQLGRR